MLPELTVTVVGTVPRQPSELQSADSPLGRARVARGWSQDKVVRALLLLADNWDWQIASESSLKVYISDWERGARRPGETYRVLLSTLYRATPEELGFTAQRRDTAGDDLRARVNDLAAMVERLTSALSAAQGATA
ncbi:XRE family transcriptional regulator [Streptomyces sp. SID12501]|uniref:XRE family transcriptional regulator n=1 Tax=Streptomyces sp. SID12501 TaxID=2706042 RepID=A0A6B3BSG8_9ACTN|nr:XRE family transcriptional regulator [Streptomyces sp. SID12501]NEC87291.1 XRE family transcriptional regulator [Streptomyces sp. SID12501]